MVRPSTALTGRGPPVVGVVEEVVVDGAIAVKTGGATVEVVADASGTVVGAMTSAGCRLSEPVQAATTTIGPIAQRSFIPPMMPRPTTGVGNSHTRRSSDMTPPEPLCAKRQARPSPQGNREYGRFGKLWSEDNDAEVS